MNFQRREDSEKLEMQPLQVSYDDKLPCFYNWNYNCLRNVLCTNILCYCLRFVLKELLQLHPCDLT